MEQENYFELFDLPLRFDLDTAKLEEVYLQLQQRFHPDNYAAADVLQQSIAAKKSSLVNIAYRELLNPTRRAAHMMRQLPGADVARLDGEQTIDDTEFLMQQMQWRERIEESDAGDLPQLLQEIEQQQQIIYKDFAALYDRHSKTPADEDLIALTALITKMQYFGKLEQQVRARQ